MGREYEMRRAVASSISRDFVEDRPPDVHRFSRASEEKMDVMQLVAMVMAGGLFVYLLVAMLCPEKFS